MPDAVLAGLAGADRAAILLLSLGEGTAAEVLRHMGPKDVQTVGASMAALTDVSAEQMQGVLNLFLDNVGRHTALGIDSEKYLRGALMQALGEDKAGAIIDRIMVGSSAFGLESLKWMEPRAIAEMIRFEHPQIIALILAYLEGDSSAAILQELSPKVRVDVMMRVATLDAIQPAALAQLNEVLERQVSGASSMQSARIGGTKTAANIFNFIDSSVEVELMDALKGADPELGQEIQELMFVFDNLNELEDTALQALLREVSSESLMLALKGADEPIKEKFFANMSKRAAEMMRDDLEAKGPVRVSEVEVAQKEIVGIARRLADEGQIALGGKGGEDFV